MDWCEYHCELNLSHISDATRTLSVCRGDCTVCKHLKPYVEQDNEQENEQDDQPVVSEISPMDRYDDIDDIYDIDQVFTYGFRAGFDAVCRIASSSDSLSEFFERIKKVDHSDPENFLKNYNFETGEYKGDGI